MGVVAGLWATGGEVLTLLAGEKYADAAPVIPFVIAAFCIDGGSPFFCAGMYLRKKNRLLVPFVVAAAILNVILNVILIPVLGIVGSALATLISYTVMCAAAWTVGARYLPLRFPFFDLFKFATLAAVMYAAVVNVHATNGVVDLAAKVLVGMVVYALLVVAFDKTCREWAVTAVSAGRARMARGGAR
jgi:O-antigen/teichoic acid export membrane protein